MFVSMLVDTLKSYRGAGENKQSIAVLLSVHWSCSAETVDNVAY